MELENTISAETRRLLSGKGDDQLLLGLALLRLTSESVRGRFELLPAGDGRRWSLRWAADLPEWRLALVEGVRLGERGQAWLLLHDRKGSPRRLEDWLAWLRTESPQAPMVPWPYGRLDPQARVGRNYLSIIRQIDDLSDARLRLLEAMLSLSAIDDLTVVGHGRAGALASVLAPWLEAQLSRPGRPRLRVLSYGAPAAGDWAFADGLDAHYGVAQGRCLNRLDPMPYCWGGLGWLVGSYADGPALPTAIRHAMIELAEQLQSRQLQYAQPRGGRVLESQLARGLSWMGNANWQHDLEGYERLLQTGRQAEGAVLPMEMAG